MNPWKDVADYLALRGGGCIRSTWEEFRFTPGLRGRMASGGHDDPDQGYAECCGRGQDVECQIPAESNGLFLQKSLLSIGVRNTARFTCLGHADEAEALDSRDDETNDRQYPRRHCGCDSAND
jgi:hypothetical protein